MLLYSVLYLVKTLVNRILFILLLLFISNEWYIKLLLKVLIIAETAQWPIFYQAQISLVLILKKVSIMYVFDIFGNEDFI